MIMPFSSFNVVFFTEHKARKGAIRSVTDSMLVHLSMLLMVVNCYASLTTD